ncbi:MAG TPA: STAS/SEC14 domain-containing protein [Planctomycetota bacterium]|nr:STAS/SEC14 domain-containing protein [Planctomycetota bacterium]
MSIQLNEHRAHNILDVRVSGRLGREDYHQFVPEFERLLALHGKVRILLQMVEFHGWTPGAFWEDLKFDFRHFNHLDRIAMVGDKRWEKAMSFFCRPFTTATIRWFEYDELDQARAWLAEAEEHEPHAGSHSSHEPPLIPPPFIP